MTVTALDHVALPAGDIKTMAAFYRALGFDVRDDPDLPLFTVHFGTSKINFHHPRLWQSERFTLRAHAATPGSGDLCFVFAGSPETLDAVLTSAGAVRELGPVARVGGRDTEGSSVYTRDPDGNLLEFIIYD